MKTSAEYGRGLRESRSVEEAEVMLVGFRMRNGFRERLVKGVGERVSWKESWRAGVSGGEARRRDVEAARHPQKGSMGTGALGGKV